MGQEQTRPWLESTAWFLPRSGEASFPSLGEQDWLRPFPPSTKGGAGSWAPGRWLGSESHTTGPGLSGLDLSKGGRMCAVPYHSWKQMFLPWEEGVQAGGAAVTRVSCRASGDNGPRLHVTGLRGGRGCGARKATNTALSGEVAEPGGPGAVTCLLQRGLCSGRGGLMVI